MLIRSLYKSDKEKILELDKLSGFNIGDDIDDYEEGEQFKNTYGIFDKEKLIGYLDIGYADDFPEYKTDPHYTENSRVIYGLFIRKEYRNQGFGSQLLMKAINMENAKNDGVFLTMMHNGLINFYKPLGFTKIAREDTPNCLVLDSKEEI